MAGRYIWPLTTSIVAAQKAWICKHTHTHTHYHLPLNGVYKDPFTFTLQHIITPIWTYGIELWGCICKSNIAVTQRCQSKILRAIVYTPRYVTKDMIHTDLGIPTVNKVIHDSSIKHRTIPLAPTNPTSPTRQHHTKTEEAVAGWPVIRWTRFVRGDLITPVCPKVRLPASPFAYRILCTLIAD